MPRETEMSMRRSARYALGALGLFAIAACSSSSSTASSHDARLIQGFDPPGPEAGQVQVLAPTIKAIPAGADVTYCSYIPNPFGDKEVDVTAALGFQSKFGHHAILLAPATDQKTGDTHECTDKDMNNARYLAGASDAALNIKIPDGIAFRIKPGGVILVQSHWINTSDKAVEGQASFNLSLQTPDGTRQPAQLFAVVGTQIDLKGRQAGHLVTECVMKSPVQLFELGGHEHEWGSHVKIEKVVAGQSSMLYDQDWKPEFQSNPPFNHYEVKAPLSFAVGDVVRVTCDWNNTTDTELTFPREMCVGVGFNFPATADITCVDGVWGSN